MVIASPTRLISAETTDLFIDVADECLQVVRVRIARSLADSPLLVEVVGDRVEGAATVPPGSGAIVVDVPVRTVGAVGAELAASAVLNGTDDAVAVTVVVAEPGWTIHLLSHFHFDPVWWNTQAGSVTEWAQTLWSGTPQIAFQKAAVDVLLDHIRLAEVDPDYRFVVAELDYLKPFRDRYPEHRATLARLMAEGRVEVVGGTWNEPDTVLPAIETLRRNFRYGLDYQRGVLGAHVTTAWALDVFGHAPQFPAVAAEAGITAVALARGAYHQWGQLRDSGFDAPHDEPRQHASDTAWSAPGGRSIHLHSLPTHYTGGHPLDRADTIEEAERLLLEWLALMRPHAAARAVIVPAGTDLSPPVRWITALPEHFRATYAWPAVRCSLPSDAFGGIADEARARPRPGHAAGLRTLTRDLNPIYTGKDVSYADVKAAHSRIERLARDAELWEALLGDNPQSTADIDRVWRLLVWLSHHDSVTGTSSDQVYVDLVGAWMDAHERATRALSSALGRLGRSIDTGERHGVPVVVAASGTSAQGGLVRTTIDVSALASPGVTLVDREGAFVPMVVERADRAPDGTLTEIELVALCSDVPGLGYTTYWLVGATDLPVWTADDTTGIRSHAYEVGVDPERGGAIVRFIDLATGRSMIPPGRLAGELVVDLEHPTHPQMGEGPWHLLPTGSRERTRDRPATRVTRQRSAIGERLVVEGPLPPACGAGAVHTTTYFLASDGAGGLAVTHRLHGQTIDDRLIRAGWPLPIAGARPVAAVGEAVIGRGHGFTTADSAVHPWTLDSAFHGWLGQSTVCRIVLHPPGRAPSARAVGAVEIIAPDGDDESQRLGDVLAAALARSGVTATPTRDVDARVGSLALDSNLIDLRIVICGVDGDGQPTASVLRDRGEEVEAGVEWIPAEGSVEEQWVPGADLTGLADLPILSVIADSPSGRSELIAALVDSLDGRHEMDVHTDGEDAQGESENYSAALVTLDAHSGVVETDGTMWLNLRRSSTAWPAGQWIDPPRRTLPDGSSFASQHWTHEVRYAVVSGPGDWRQAGIDRAADGVLRPLRAGAAAGGGTRPTRGNLLVVEGDVRLEALRPAGPGRTSLRLSQLGSTPTTATVRGARGTEHGTPGDIVAARHSDLFDTRGDELERRDAGWVVEVLPVASATVILEQSAAQEHSAVREHSSFSENAVAPSAPVFSRWWTQNTGPPPAAGLPVAVHARAVTTERLNASGEVDLVVSSDAAVGLDVDLEFTLAPGAVLVAGARTLRVPARGFARTRCVIENAPDRASVLVRAIPRDTTYPTTWDVVHIGPHRTSDLVRMIGDPAPLALAPADAGELVVAVEWTGTIPMLLDARVVAPFGSWQLFPEPTQDTWVEPGSTEHLRFVVRAPRGAAPGRWWALIVVRVADRVLYSRTVDIVVDEEWNGIR
ncbi:hypothetical protein M4I32_12690 [Microbacterium sp. LRZ72]|uniref:glycoside hydrolase family 38 N-terminal domain-containing protein n=1 Tax=Microbacterium sp. LRZ72 TaxID=2942481 RepID=UPI0029B16E71|nr:hypothetical protein [Microbacterium sp. LRZ72]MDX2377659.1 hypothetical protein [Microbacterium sp. LRZ72]